MVLSVAAHLDPERDVRFFKPISVAVDQLPPPYNQQLAANTQFYRFVSSFDSVCLNVLRACV